MYVDSCKIVHYTDTYATANLLEKNTDNLFTAAMAISIDPLEDISPDANLGRAAFWVHIRQDIHIALLLQVPVSVDYPPCIQKDKIYSRLYLITSGQIAVTREALDCAWANHMASLLIEVINYCFGSNPRGLETWLSLCHRRDHWLMAKPSSFKPYYERGRALAHGRPFPEIWISSDCQVIAWLYYHTATVLLRTYPPGNRHTNGIVPLIDGLANREEVLLHARAICGIVTTNPNAQALIVMCHMAVVAARFFTEKVEQDETLNLLRTAHAVTGHPYVDIETRLCEYWGRSATT